MQRRIFIALRPASIPSTAALGLAPRRCAFKVKTKGGGIVGNVVIEAGDVEAANTKR